jgi:hypothetical protein
MCVIYVGCELSFLIADAMLRRITSNNNVTPSVGGGNNMVWWCFGWLSQRLSATSCEGKASCVVISAAECLRSPFILVAVDLWRSSASVKQVSF